ncbi:hypothetical protein GCM10022384_57210 [Streptomyces marokkonensis]|uniref:Transposase n=1 Tax=Streptomyces marokkonensis TaxID=324855 RepID=A0ABP7RW12_9ACTN
MADRPQAAPAVVGEQHLDRLLQHVQAVADATGDIDWDINIDSSSVRAHQHAAGAPKHDSFVSSSPSKNGEARGESGTVDSGEPA